MKAASTRESGRESLDCALGLQELVRMGVDNIITFDAHDPRVQNAIPLNGFETIRPTYQFVKGLLKHVPDLQIDADHMMAISRMKVQPDVQSTLPTYSDSTWVCSTNAVTTQPS